VQLFNLIKDDFESKRILYAYDNTTAGKLKTFFSDGTSAIFLYRLMQYFNHMGLMPVAIIFQYINKLINGCLIGLKANFGAGLVLVHPIGIVINSSVIGGENIILQSSVVIGENKGKSPQLANNIIVGSGAKLLGDIFIHNNVSIGANAVVLKSVAENQKAFGVPAHKN